MSDHSLRAVMTMPDRQRRFLCICGEGGLAVPSAGAARADHEGHARARRLHDSATPEGAGS